MNKQVSVQYAYKKDGKGERHGDEAERMLASQARKHNVQLPTQHIVVPSAGPVGIPNGDSSRPVSTGPQTPDLGMGRGMPPMGYQNVPPPQIRPAPGASSLATPPPGLPARPPPSQGGYGGPQSFVPPVYNAAAQQPAGFGPPGFNPPSSTTGVPPPLPPGFQQPGYGNGR